MDALRLHNALESALQSTLKQYEIFRLAIEKALSGAVSFDDVYTARANLHSELNTALSVALYQISYISTQVLSEVVSQRFTERGLTPTEKQSNYLELEANGWGEKLTAQLKEDVRAVRQLFNQHALLAELESSEKEQPSLALVKLDKLGRRYDSALFVEVTTNHVFHKMANDIVFAYAISQQRPLKSFDPKQKEVKEHLPAQFGELEQKLHPRSKLILY